MRTFATILTAITLLAHAVFGCCRHEKASPSASTEASPVPAPTCRCHHIAPTQLVGLPADSPDDDSDGCCRQLCHALPLTNADPVGDADSFREFPPAGHVALDANANAGDGGSCFNIAKPTFTALPLRAELSVWLL